jgi:hypothetical protein
VLRKRLGGLIDDRLRLGGLSVSHLGLGWGLIVVKNVGVVVVKILMTSVLGR